MRYLNKNIQSVTANVVSLSMCAVLYLPTQTYIIILNTAVLVYIIPRRFHSKNSDSESSLLPRVSSHPVSTVTEARE